MKYLERIALSAILLTPLVASSATGQVWVPGNQPQDRPTQPGQSVPASASLDAPVAAPEAQPVALPVKDKDSRLSSETRLELIRYVSGEFARTKSALPGGKKVLKVRVGEPVDRKALLSALEDGGVAVSPGDNVQITKLDFGGSEIVVQLNGGGDGGKTWRDRIQISGMGGGSGGGSPVSTSSTVQEYGAVATTVNPGTTVEFDFGRPLPEMTPDELKQYLGIVLDFSKQRSAAVQWADSQPPAIREAIAAKRAEVGMDEEQVLAALGRPGPASKIRERQPDGTETEDWIYGQPPGKTIFVRFAHGKVIGVKQYPLP